MWGVDKGLKDTVGKITVNKVDANGNLVYKTDGTTVETEDINVPLLDIPGSSVV